ncbi:MAG TPA: AbrB/MazE/SpoVT family DNA-binding domain-containing protein [Clostridia bacterium]|jgi:transcriptional pleiotropic regulator of transition state genes|nr:AbrB family transcriptional regulator [Clostridiaceae bacterium]HOF27498.1 AbrB/MazE/SpoVT family DNA-binding domain-containing protein [Clostridia bacterium]HOM35252.1 AbrB/MazE/SpoVT family DNA-binding domain-containing protein [Clostridia bacterium]HOT71239.1 AbrB/MazE/SpoVT family DNA-binding domain-containing protein [Clostridia bacterium]HQG01058.1 AbrB/MazE/SpoVT family DNA-binding domain-containing protein [Clostridia bacterium]
MVRKNSYTTVIRRLDPLGRIVLPKKYRKKCEMNVKDDVEMYLEGSAICVKKYNTRCKLCGETDNLIEFKGANLCPACVTGIKRLNF